MESGTEDLKVLQTAVVVLTTNTVVRGPMLAKVTDFVIIILSSCVLRFVGGTWLVSLVLAPECRIYYFDDDN